MDQLERGASDKEGQPMKKIRIFLSTNLVGDDASITVDVDEEEWWLMDNDERSKWALEQLIDTGSIEYGYEAVD